MKVLFLSTNINTYHHNCDLLPIGVGILSAYLKQSGHDIRAFTAVRTSEFPKLRRVLREFRPDAVAYSVITGQSPNIPLLARIVKEWNPRAPFLCGGAHPTLSPEEVIALPDVDIVCVGDGEISLKEYLESLARGKQATNIPGFWFKGPDGGIVRNRPRPFFQDLDKLPFVDREIVDFQRVLNSNTGILWMLASRGCKWKCSFCSVPRLRKIAAGEHLRMRSVDHVLAEIRDCARKYDFKTVAFRDDTFTWNREWTLEFCAKYAREFRRWPVMCLTRSDVLDDEIVGAMKEANFQEVWIGYETGNDHIRNDIIHKEIETEQFVAACEMLGRNGICVCVLNIVGLPGETPEMFRQTIEVNRRVYSKHPVFAVGGGSAPKIFTFEPFPGTPLFRLCRSRGWLRRERLTKGFRTHVDSYVDIPTFPRELVLQELRRFRFNVYKGHHNTLALFYLFYDSRTAELLRAVLPTKTIYACLSGLLNALGGRH